MRLQAYIFFPEWKTVGGQVSFKPIYMPSRLLSLTAKGSTPNRPHEINPVYRDRHVHAFKATSSLGWISWERSSRLFSCRFCLSDNRSDSSLDATVSYVMFHDAHQNEWSVLSFLRERSFRYRATTENASLCMHPHLHRDSVYSVQQVFAKP